MPHPYSGNGLYVDMGIYKIIIRILFIYLLVMVQMFTCLLNTLRWKGKKGNGVPAFNQARKPAGCRGVYT
jgi:hypothetical protein